MSGIVGLFNVDGAPVDRDVAQRLTDVMVYRGPDRQNLWVDGAVGLGHTLLTTTDEDRFGPQPFSLDGNVWIVADARVDARGELRDALVLQRRITRRAGRISRHAACGGVV